MMQADLQVNLFKVRCLESNTETGSDSMQNHRKECTGGTYESNLEDFAPNLRYPDSSEV